MATYLELRALFNESDLVNKLQVACLVAAEAIRIEDGGTTNHANRLIWAKACFDNPQDKAEKLLMAVLASNKDLTVVQITGASDAALQTKVDAAIDVFADGS